MSRNKPPLSWAFWHPHQGLWNWTLVSAIRKAVPVAPIYKAIMLVVILLDTLFLFLHALVTRIGALGLSKVFSKARLPEDMSVLYLDAGTHKEGVELSFVVDSILPPICSNFEAYGFEASQQSYEHAARKFADRKNIHIVHTALTHTLPANGKLRLYKDLDSGIGDSLYRETAEYEEVEAKRLSDFLIENHLVTNNTIVLLRMNIEGAEDDVLRDLVESGLAQSIDGYFGMWDDVSKIDVERDAEFRTFLARYRIHTFTFNERDLRWFLRRKCIAYHVQTRIIQGVRKRQRSLSSGSTRTA